MICAGLHSGGGSKRITSLGCAWEYRRVLEDVQSSPLVEGDVVDCSETGQAHLRRLTSVADTVVFAAPGTTGNPVSSPT